MGRSARRTRLGIAPAASLINLRVLNSQGIGTVSGTLAALDWVMANKAAYNIRVVNMSLGTDALFPSYCDSTASFAIAFATAINTLRSHGALVFVSAGNGIIPVKTAAIAQ